MKNTRHISIYNEFKIFSQDFGGNFLFNVTKNINPILLNKSLKYKIENLSIDIGSTNLNLKEINFDAIDGLAFPIRFYLDNDPLKSEWTRLKSIYPSIQFVLNNNIIVSINDLGLPQSQDIVDSSDVYYQSNRFYNTLFLTQVNANPELTLQLSQTQTVAEYNYFNLSNNKVVSGANTYYDLIITNNDLSDFYFDSKAFNYLVISIYPLIKYFISGAGYQLILNSNITINFDLIEESPR
jgi:hypothetical protein